MKVIFTKNASEDKAYWDKTNKKISKRIDRLIEDIKLHPFEGIGKPEPLKFDLSGYWSRRIDYTHRLVYKVHENTIYIAQCRFHYT